MSTVNVLQNSSSHWCSLSLTMTPMGFPSGDQIDQYQHSGDCSLVIGQFRLNGRVGKGHYAWERERDVKRYPPVEVAVWSTHWQCEPGSVVRSAVSARDAILPAVAEVSSSGVDQPSRAQNSRNMRRIRFSFT